MPATRWSRTVIVAALAAVGAVLTACGENGGNALAATEAQPADHSVTPGEFPAAPPPFSDGIFPCSRCHEGGETVADTAPAQPHVAHGSRGLECEDCHAPEGGDPVLPDVEICWECHDLEEEDTPPPVIAYFDRVRTGEDEYAFTSRWNISSLKPIHARHEAAEVECADCHGELTDGPVSKPKPITLMNRCITCHKTREKPTDCQTCHIEKRELPHADIKLDHAEDQRGCLDCHDEADRDHLHRADGKLIAFAESFQLCGQCHGPKLRDWKLGLHGKRTGRWDGRKEYLLCAHCHNPHSPRIPGTTPMAGPAHPEDVR